MGHVKTLFKKHWVALVLGAVIGLLAAAPYIYFAVATQGYRGISLMGQASEEYYIARIQEVYNGHPLVENMYLPFKNVPYIVPAVGEDIDAYIGMLLHLSPANTSILFKFLSVTGVFLLVYMLAFRISGSRIAGLLAATCTIIGTDVMSSPASLLGLLHGTGGYGMWWARPINPEISGVFMFASLYLIYRAYYEHIATRVWHSLVLGLLIGLCLYISIYAWLFLGMLIFIIFTYELWQKRFDTAKSACLAGIVALACDIPFIINYLHARQHEGYAKVQIQQGVIVSHAPMVGIWLILLLLIPLFAWPKQFAKARGFFAASALSLFVVLNQQVISGLYEQPVHFHWYITKPIVAIMLSLLAFYIITTYIRVARLRYSLYAAAITLLLLYSIFSQATFYRLNAPEAIAAQSYAPLIDYLNAQEPQTVLTSQIATQNISRLSDYLSIYTKANTPENKYAPLSLAPRGYFEELLFLRYRLRGVAPQDALQTMQAERYTILLGLYGEYWQLDASTTRAISDNEVPLLATQYAAEAHRTIPSMMQELGITMLIEDTMAERWKIPADSGLTVKDTVAGRFIIYTSVGSTSVKK